MTHEEKRLNELEISIATAMTSAAKTVTKSNNVAYEDVPAIFGLTLCRLLAAHICATPITARQELLKFYTEEVIPDYIGQVQRQEQSKADK